MAFLKKHYEKILVGLVLLGLAVAIASLNFKIAVEKEDLEKLRQTLIHPKVKPLSNLDLTLPETVLKRVAVRELVDFSSSNRLFNPMQWVKTPDNRIIRSTRIGPEAAIATNIAPLYLRLTLDSINVTDAGPRYVIGVEKEAAANPSQRKKKQSYCRLHDKTDTFILRDIKGPPENPTQLIVELTDTGETVVVTKDQPFKRIDGYMADLRY